MPLLRKTPFHLDPRPLTAYSTAHAGLLSASRALRSLQLPGAVEANVSLKQRDRGPSEARYVESAVLLHIAGGEGYEDAAVLASDRRLERVLGERLKLSVLVTRVTGVAKRFFGVPEFHYYTLADGIGMLLPRLGGWSVPSRSVACEASAAQPWLFHLSWKTGECPNLLHR